MEFIKFLFVFIELMIVIESSYSFIQCELPVLENGSVRLRQKGKLIRYSCSSTFKLFGARISQCVQGQWQHPVPVCIKRGCALEKPDENGFTFADEGGAINLLFCAPGYSLAGNRQTYCNGTAWQRPLGTCRKDQAGPAMSCDFKVVSICDWQVNSTEWKRINGYTLVRQLQTVPTIGESLDGHFKLASFATFTTQSSNQNNSTTRLIFPVYPADASSFRIHYQMYSFRGSLRVNIKPASCTIADVIDSPEYLALEKRRSDEIVENVWLESVFESTNINEYDQSFQIVIEATAVRKIRNTTAIDDDIALLSGADCRSSTAFVLA